MTTPISPNSFPTTIEEAVRWWRQRRLRFNAVLLVIGVLSFLGTLMMIDMMPREPGEDPGDFLGMCCAVPIYAFLANVCYTAGALVERHLPMADPAAAQRRRDNLYRRGMLFSCVLTALPFLLTSVGCIMSRIRQP